MHLSLNTLIAAGLLSASFVSANRALSLTFEGPKTVDGVENLKVVAKITNTGDETLKILDDPRSLISKRPVNKFAIGRKGGARGGRSARPSFTGIRVKYSPEAAAQMGAYTVLAPGQSLTVAHDLSQAYNFTESGVGAYEIEADNTFYIVNEDNQVGVVYAEESDAHVAEIAGNLAVARRDEFAGLSKRATFVSCSSTRQTQLNSAASAAQGYATEVLNYLKGMSGTATTRYKTWFGTYASSRHSTLLDHSTKIAANTFSTYTYDCSCTDSAYAYVYPDNFGRVYLCSAFWNAPLTGTDSKAGTIIHEASHFTRNGGTDDYGYGHTNAKNLASTNPARAIMNADNREYFAENTPFLA